MTPAEMCLIRGLLQRVAVATPDGPRMTDPRPGDLVVETSNYRCDPDGIGVLLRGDGSSWVIEPLAAPGTEQTWGNADFVAVPAELAVRVLTMRAARGINVTEPRAR